MRLARELVLAVRLVLATFNPHKVTELSRILDGAAGRRRESR